MASSNGDAKQDLIEEIKKWKRLYENERGILRKIRVLCRNANCSEVELYGETTGKRRTEDVMVQELLTRLDRLNMEK